MKNNFWDKIDTFIWRSGLHNYFSMRFMIKLGNLAEGRNINYLSPMQKEGFKRGLK